MKFADSMEQIEHPLLINKNDQVSEKKIRMHDDPFLIRRPFFCRNHQNVTLTLAWNIIPNAGNLPRIASTGSHSFKFPADYATTKAV